MLSPRVYLPPDNPYVLMVEIVIIVAVFLYMGRRKRKPLRTPEDILKEKPSHP